MRKKIIILGFLLNGFTLLQAQTIQLYVAPTGNDKNDGSINQPLATLQKAKELVRQLKNQMPINKALRYSYAAVITAILPL